MAYEKTNWSSGDVITAEKLNNMEDGIVNSLSHFVIYLKFLEGENAYTLYEQSMSFEEYNNRDNWNQQPLIVLDIGELVEDEETALNVFSSNKCFILNCGNNSKFEYLEFSVNSGGNEILFVDYVLTSENDVWGLISSTGQFSYTPLT